MLIVHVSVSVKPESVEAFKAATIENARHSVHEPGIACFDVVQQIDDPTRFVLVEVVADLHIPSLRAYGIGDEHVADLSREAEHASSMKANPIALNDEELQATLRAAL